MSRNLSVVGVSLAVLMISGSGFAVAETYEESHVHLYATGEVLSVGQILDLSSIGEGSVANVSFRYNMVRSALQAEWLYDGEVIGRGTLPKGQGQTASFDYGKKLPASIEVRFVGPAGHVQVLAVKVVTVPPLEVTGGTAATATSGGGLTVTGEGVSAAVTPTPRQLDLIEPTLILPVDPEAEGFDDSKCERLVCTLPPDWLDVGDTGQQYVSSFYLLFRHAGKAARLEMPPEGHCAWWDRPMGDDEPRQVLAASYNARIDIRITWEPEITYSFKPHRANINYDQEEPGRFIKLWDSVMAGGWLDLCVEPRVVHSVTYLAVVGQY